MLGVEEEDPFSRLFSASKRLGFSPSAIYDVPAVVKDCVDAVLMTLTDNDVDTSASILSAHHQDAGEISKHEPGHKDGRCGCQALQAIVRKGVVRRRE